MIKLLSTVAILTTLFSCNTSKNTTVFTLITKQDSEFIKVDAQGGVTIRNRKAGKLDSNGTLYNLENDTLAMRQQDGTVYVNNKPIAKILDNGTIDMGITKTLSWGKQGTLALSDSEVLKIEPNNASFYKNASLLFLIYATFDVVEFSTLQQQNNTTEQLIMNENESNSKEIEQASTIKTPQITRFVSGFAKTTNYGGSIPEIGPDKRYYTDYDVLKETNETTKKEFHEVMVNYLDNTLVNNSISLRKYLKLLYENDQTKLKEIHDKRPPQAMGNSIVYYPTLLFHGGLAEPTFVLHPNNVELKGMGESFLNLFLEKHGHIFSSELPEDEFYMKYFLKF